MKIRILIVAVFLFMLVVFANAQAPDTLWTRNYGYSGSDEAWQLKPTPDGGFIIVGYSEVDDDIYLLKTDENGDTLWTSMLGFTSDDIGRSVEPLDDGGYIIAGYAGGYIALMKTDSLGNHLWHHYLDEGWGRAVKVTSDSGFIVAGFTPVEGNGLDIYLAKTNSDGDLIWSRTYGGANPERAWDIWETPAGDFIVLGWTESYGLGDSDIYVIKTDANGDTLWTRTYGSTLADEGRSLLLKEDGGFVLAGKIYNDGTQTDVVVINADANGDTIWTMVLPEGGIQIANSISACSNGGYIVAGMKYESNSLYSGFILKIDSDGGILWSKRIYDSGQNLYLRSIVQVSDGGYVAAGYHQLPNQANDVFLVKLGPDITGIDDDLTTLPDQISLYQNYPNPFNASTTISFDLSEKQEIRVAVYDILGRQTEMLFDGMAEAGYHSVIFDSSEMSSGIYFYNLRSGNLSRTRSMILLK